MDCELTEDGLKGDTFRLFRATDGIADGGKEVEVRSEVDASVVLSSLFNE